MKGVHEWEDPSQCICCIWSTEHLWNWASTRLISWAGILFLINYLSPPKFDLISFSLVHSFRYSSKFYQFWLHHKVLYPTYTSQEWSETLMFCLCWLYHISLSAYKGVYCPKLHIQLFFFIKWTMFILLTIQFIC